MEPLYQTNVKCACCGDTFATSKVRPSFKKPVAKDTDFYQKYNGINPDYYVIRVCPHCGYSCSESFTEKLNQQQVEKIRSEVSAHWTKKDYGGERDWDQALATFKLGLICAQLIGEKERVIAGLLHHIAWLYREKDDWEQEEKFLKFALDAYIAVYEREGMEINNAKLMYVIGELYRRIKSYQEAVKWFSRIIQDKRIMDAAIIKKARDQWALIRDEMLSSKMELPAEMREAENA
ncbi:MAG TPA: DUF2225 domain-containing protein [Bacilli bacterium]